jgi:hypothetical protein
MSKDDEERKKDPPLAAAAAAKPASSSPSIADALYAVETLVQVFGFSVEAANQAVNDLGSTDVTECYNYILNQGLGTDTGGAVYPIENCPHIPTKVVGTIKKDPSVDPKVFQQVCQYHSMTTTTTTTKTTTKYPPTISASPPARTLSSSSETVGKFKEDTVPANDDDDDDDDDGDSTPVCPNGENWLCLTCRRVLCSRYVNGHGLQHWKDTCCQEENERVGDTKKTAATGHCVAVSLADLSVWCHVCEAYLVHDEEILKPIVAQLERLKFADE